MVTLTFTSAVQSYSREDYLLPVPNPASIHPDESHTRLIQISTVWPEKRPATLSHALYQSTPYDRYTLHENAAVDDLHNTW